MSRGTHGPKNRLVARHVSRKYQQLPAQMNEVAKYDRNTMKPGVDGMRLPINMYTLYVVTLQLYMASQGSSNLSNPFRTSVAITGCHLGFQCELQLSYLSL